MSEPRPPQSPEATSADAEEQIEALAERYLDALQTGTVPDRQALVAAYPDIADRLARRLALVEMLYRSIQARAAAVQPQAPGDEAAGPPALPDAPPSAGNGAAPAGPAGVGERAVCLKCPHCGNRIQLVQAEPQEVTCQNCGSSFHVDPRATTASRPEDMPETVGKFLVLDLLGRGAFGAVYKCHDPELDRIVAVKVPRAGYFQTAEEQERFLREARSAARLSHPGIVPVHEVGRADNLPYLVSDYVAGVTLADRLTAGRPGSRESAELVAQLADALDYAHRNGVVHRDIKPSNILLQASREEGVGSREWGVGKREAGARPSSPVPTSDSLLPTPYSPRSPTSALPGATRARSPSRSTARSWERRPTCHRSRRPANRGR